MEANKETIERLDRLENHFKVYKDDTKELKTEVKELRILLGGTALNGNKGFVKLMELVEEKVDLHEKQILTMQNELSQVKFWGRSTAGILFVSIGLLIKRMLNL